MRIAFRSFMLAPFILAAGACSSSPASESATGSSTGATGATTGTMSSGTTSGTSTGTGGASGTGGSSGTGGAGLTAAQACSDSAHASCTQRDKCSNDNANKLHFGDEATCESRTETECLANLSAMGTGQTPEGLEACVAAYPKYACVDFLDDNPPFACLPPEGTGATGAACAVSAQCGSTYCAIAEFAVCGTCQPLPAAGAPCTVAADCGRDLACSKVGQAPMGTCTAFVASGGGCDATHPCAADLACVGAVATPAKMGMCMPAGATVGAKCDSSRATAASCDAQLGLVCVPAAKGSTLGACATIELVAAGSACGDIGMMPITGFADCEAGGLCVKAVATDNVGVCAAPAADNAACDSDPTKGPPCLAPAKCVPAVAGATAGVCTVPVPTKCM